MYPVPDYRKHISLCFNTETVIYRLGLFVFHSARVFAY